MDIGATAVGLVAMVVAQGPVPIHTLEGELAGERFGAAVAGVGDIDGDGLGDVAVGAPRADSSGPLSGRVQVFSGADGSELLRLHGSGPSAWFGASVAGVGDVDGDGRDDLVVGSPLGTPAEGSARVFSGRTGAVLWTWAGDAPGDQFGHAVGGPGDVDGDGFPDVVVGAPHADSGGTSAGRVRVFSGATGLVLHTFDGTPWDQLGSSVSGVGDVDGDGAADVLLGAPLADGPAFNTGSAFLCSGATGRVLLAFHGAVVGDRLGSTVARAGDVNADGVPDLLLGVPAADAGAFDAGRVEVRSGAGGALLWSVSGSFAGEYLEEADGVGDVNGDGCDDVAVGSPGAGAQGSERGRVTLCSGRNGAPLFVFHGRKTRDWFGHDVAAVGDVDGNGRPDLIAGAPGHDDETDKEGYAQVLWTLDQDARIDERPPSEAFLRKP